jgi:hypothetical protein
MPEPNEAPQPNQGNFTVSAEYSMPQPPRRRACFMPFTEWERIIRAMKKIAPPEKAFHSAGWLFAGMTITSFLGMWIKGDFSLHTNVVSWGAVICFGVLALALLRLDRLQRQDIAQSVTSVVEEMQELEKIYFPSEDADAGRKETAV